MELKGFQRSYLMKLAHDISPLVMLGTKGLTDALISQTNEALEHHELIKVKFQDNKKSRKELTMQLSEATDADLVRLIGNIAILFRHAREPEHRSITLPSRK